MTEGGDKDPIINVSSYLRDLYQLITLLLADENVARDEHFRRLSEVHHETEVNRLLIWIATATRQFLDLKYRPISDAPCGQYWDIFPGDVVDDLRFRQACNIIIHAVEIISYDPECGYHRGTITIRGRRRGSRRQANRALLEFDKFAKYCIVLTTEFLGNVSHGD